MQIITTQSCHHLHNRLITMLGVGQQCVIECQKHNEVKFLKKTTTKLGFQNMSHIHILFTMLIILNITTKWLYCFNNVKTSYMLDFNEVFWPMDKRGKNAENAKNTRKTQKTCGKRRKFHGKSRILKLLWRTHCVADGAHAGAARCGCRFQNADALRCGRGLFAHL